MLAATGVLAVGYLRTLAWLARPAPGGLGVVHRVSRVGGVGVGDKGADQGIAVAGMAGQLLLVGAAEQQGNKSVAHKQAGIAQPAIQAVAQHFRLGTEDRGKSGDQLVGNIGHQRAKHRRHQGALLVGQAAALVEEEIGHGDRQPVEPRTRARGIDRAVGCRCSERPFHGHHATVINRRS